MKNETQYVGFAWFIIAAIMFHVEHKENKHKDLVIEKAWKIIQYQSTETSVIQKESWDKDTINLILRNKISGRAERELQADTVYMNLVTKEQ